MIAWAEVAQADVIEYEWPCILKMLPRFADREEPMITGTWYAPTFEAPRFLTRSQKNITSSILAPAPVPMIRPVSGCCTWSSVRPASAMASSMAAAA